jgi:hypothetical protein
MNPKSLNFIAPYHPGVFGSDDIPCQLFDAANPHLAKLTGTHPQEMASSIPSGVTAEAAYSM